MFPDYLDGLAVSGNIVHVAALLYLAGFLFRNQLILRALIVAGDLVYMLYFYFAPDVPLWGGIFWSAMFTLVNLVMIGLILADRLHFSLRIEERKLFRLLEDLTPGQFRTFMRAARFEMAPTRRTIIWEGKRLDKLYFVIDGNVTIEKRGRSEFTGSRTFFGEDAFLLATPSATTVTLEPGCQYFVWNAKTLKALLAVNHGLNTALGRVLNKKLAHKIVKASVIMDTVVIAARR
jgi:CRP-like cAMP-binding protein